MSISKSMENILLSNGYRIMHEFLFSMNIALILRWEHAQTSTSESALTLQSWINRVLYLHQHSNVGGYAAFYLLALVEAIAIFVILQGLSFAPSARRVFLLSAGIVSLLALPIAWLHFIHRYPGLQGSAALPDLPRWWLFAELLATVAGAVFFLRRRPSLQGRLGVLSVTVHFVIWGWLFLGGPYFWLAPAKLVIPITGFCSCLVWAAYVRSPGTS